MSLSKRVDKLESRAGPGGNPPVAVFEDVPPEGGTRFLLRDGRTVREATEDPREAVKVYCGIDPDRV